MRWMVTGGAGYIGAHVVKLLVERGDEVVVLDDLSTGRADRVGQATLVRGSVCDRDLVRKTLEGTDGVIHFAAHKQVGESMENPLMYYRDNIGGMEALLSGMVDSGVSRIVYSSSAAVYGMPEVDMIDEDTPLRPINPYGETKAFCEGMLSAAARVHGFRYVSLRYFNPAGAATPELGDPGVFNLIPLVFRALTTGDRPRVFGSDYATPDGTCIRDYIHVEDLAEAHLAVADALDAGTNAAVYNVGCGRGFSVLEVMRSVERVTGRLVNEERVARRAGDPPALVAGVSKISADLGWVASRTNLDEIVRSAWAAWPCYEP